MVKNHVKHLVSTNEVLFVCQRPPFLLSYQNPRRVYPPVVGGVQPRRLAYGGTSGSRSKRRLGNDKLARVVQW